MSTPLSLCNLPDVVTRIIFNKVGFKSIQSLRKVCHDLRNRIDDIKPEANLLYVHIRVTDCEFQFWYESKYNAFRMALHVEYGKNVETVENGQSTVSNGGLKKMVKGDYVELASRDFALICKFQKKNMTKIRFNSYTKHSSHFLQFLETLKSFLSFENRLLKVDEVNINTSDQKSVITALSLIDPQSIKMIGLSDWYAKNEPVEFPEIMEMEQWKTAKSFECDYTITGVSLRNFFHFSNIHVALQSISVEDLLDLKKIFQNSSEADMFYIQYKTLEGRKQFLERMGPALRMRFDDTFEWFFRISTTDDYVLWIKLEDEAIRTIKFDRLSKDNVPAYAVIQD